MKKWGRTLIGVLLAVVVYTVRDNVVGLEWDPVVLCKSGVECVIDHYEVMPVLETTAGSKQFGPFNTFNTWIEIVRPGKTGTYHFLVRAVRMGEEGALVEGDWCSSLDVECSWLSVGGFPGTWKIKWLKSR